MSYYSSWSLASDDSKKKHTGVMLVGEKGRRKEEERRKQIKEKLHKKMVGSRRNTTWKRWENMQVGWQEKGKTVSRRVDEGMKIQGKRKMAENLIHFKCEATEKEIRNYPQVTYLDETRFPVWCFFMVPGWDH